MIDDSSILWSKKNSVKDIVFKILITDHPLKLIELTNFIKKRYGKSVTFQAVRQAVFELVADGVLEREGKQFQINPAWTIEAKKTIMQIEQQMVLKTTKPSIESIKGEFSVFTFTTKPE